MLNGDTERETVIERLANSERTVNAQWKLNDLLGKMRIFSLLCLFHNKVKIKYDLCIFKQYIL